MNQKNSSGVTVSKILSYVRQYKGQIMVFIICLCVSVLLWLTIKLNRHYLHNISFRVNLTGLYDNHKLIPLHDNIVILEIKAQGYQLLFNEITMAKNLEIDLSKTLLKQSNIPDVVYISGKSLMARISAQLPFSSELLTLKPDTLFFRVENIVSVKVPVIADAALTFKPHYGLFDTTTISPDSVIVTGSHDLVSSIESISTRKLRLKQIDSSFNYKLNLINPFPDQLTMKPKEVVITGKVTRFLSQDLTLPVTFSETVLQKGAPDTEQVELRFLIPVEKKTAFSSSTISVTSESFVETDEATYALISVNAPPFVKKITVSPDRIMLKSDSE